MHRLCRSVHAASTLDGEGARLYGGRWNPKGVPMVYTASTLALAVLESFVHFSSTLLPKDYVHVRIDVPDTLAVDTRTPKDLPFDWAKAPAPDALALLGGAWLARGRTALLRVPSAIVPDESNILINPRHPDARRIRVRAVRPFAFDPRLVKR